MKYEVSDIASKLISTDDDRDQGQRHTRYRLASFDL